MKRKNIIVAFGLLVILTGCSINNELAQELEGKVTRITASGSTIKTRTSLNGNRVTWANGDKLGLIKTTDAASNKQFRLAEGMGEIDGQFEAVDVSDALDDGQWIAYYPYSATKYTAAKKFRIVSLNQASDTPAHLAQYDWLLSDPVTLTEGKLNANFKMKHVFALIEINVKLKQETVDYTELAQCVLEATDGSTIFAQNVYFGNKGDIQFDFTSKTTSVGRAPYVEFTTKNHTLWLLTRQSALKPLTVRIYFTHNSVISSAEARFTPESILEPGKKYVINLELEINEGNPNSSILTILSRS